jgi:hypothetical protein
MQSIGESRARLVIRRKAGALLAAAAATAALLVSTSPGADAAPSPYPTPTRPVVTQYGRPLTVHVNEIARNALGVDIRATWYVDAWGIPHVLAAKGDNDRANDALPFLNSKLAEEGLAYDPKTNPTGYQYVFQDDAGGRILVDTPSDRRFFTGTTADMLKLAWYNGRLISVDTVDSTGTDGSGTSLEDMHKDIRGKFPGSRKNQTENVVFTPATKEQAQALAAEYAGRTNVRIILPRSGFDTGEFTAGTEEMEQAAASSMFVPAEGDCPPADQSSSRDRPGGTGYAQPVGFTSRVLDCGGAEEEQPAKSAGGLAQEVAGQGKAPGGIDFSRLELHYLADPGKGGLRYAFQAPLATSGDRSSMTGLAGARQSSDAFFTWLELDPSTFWVNLNPDEPDRIVDSQLGKTDAGRILLQADLLLKKTTGKLIHPDTKLGDSFWKGMSGDCMSFRTWIVPGTATVYTKGAELYILKSPLNVQMETQYLKAHGGSGAVSCPKQSAAVQAHNEALFRELILPRVVSAVNTAPEYADLRRVYLSRVAAEWYRQLSAKQTTTYGPLIDKGDVTPYATHQDWKPIGTFNAYVKSYTKGEFKVTHRTRKGNTIYTNTYVYGGVDFTKVAFAAPSAAQVTALLPALSKNVDRSLKEPATDTGTHQVWLGGGDPAPTKAKPGTTAAGTRPGTSTAAGDSGSGSGISAKRWVSLAVTALVVLLILRAVIRHRRTPARR